MDALGEEGHGLGEEGEEAGSVHLAHAPQDVDRTLAAGRVAGGGNLAAARHHGLDGGEGVKEGPGIREGVEEGVAAPEELAQRSIGPGRGGGRDEAEEGALERLFVLLDGQLWVYVCIVWWSGKGQGAGGEQMGRGERVHAWMWLLTPGTGYTRGV